MASIVVIGAIPCVQEALFLEDFVPGTVNRAKSSHRVRECAVVMSIRCHQTFLSIVVVDTQNLGRSQADIAAQGFGGKGQLFSRAANTIAPGSAEVIQFVGGTSGEFVCASLDEQKIPHIDIPTAAPVRTCTTVLSTNPTAQHPETELVGVPPTVTEAETGAFLEAAHQRLAREHARAVALVGTFPESENFVFSFCQFENRRRVV